MKSTAYELKKRSLELLELVANSKDEAQKTFAENEARELLHFAFRLHMKNIMLSGHFRLNIIGLVEKLLLATAECALIMVGCRGYSC